MRTYEKCHHLAFQTITLSCCRAIYFSIWTVVLCHPSHSSSSNPNYPLSVWFTSDPLELTLLMFSDLCSQSIWTETHLQQFDLHRIPNHLQICSLINLIKVPYHDFVGVQAFSNQSVYNLYMAKKLIWAGTLNRAYDYDTNPHAKSTYLLLWTNSV